MSYAIQRPKKITAEGVESDLQPAVDLIGSTVNTFMEQAYIAIMGNLGVGTNLNMEFKTLDLKVNANGIPLEGISFKSNLKSKIVGAIVVNVFDALPISQPFISLTDKSGVVTVNYCTGLQPNIKYQLVVLTIGT